MKNIVLTFITFLRVCMNPAEPGGEPLISLEKLQQSIPSFEWAKGHSGTLLPDDVESKLIELWE